MGKHSKKRQRTQQEEKEEADIQPLGAVPPSLGEYEKDDEERRLEAFLFGTGFTPTTMMNNLQTNEVDGEGEKSGLDNVMDSDIFFMDGAGPSTISNEFGSSIYADFGTGDVNESFTLPTAIEETQNQDDQNRVGLGALSSSKGKKAAWADPDDATIQVSLTSDKRLRKLRDTTEEDTIGGRDYEARLRRQYEKVIPVPEWASTAREQLHKKKRRRSSVSDDDQTSDVETQLGSLLNSSDVLSSSRKQTLANGQISIERLRDANQSAKADGEIRAVKFHPSLAVPLLLTASADRRLRLFNIDGHTNPHLQSVHIPDLPITTAHFHPSGSSILLTGQRPFYYLYDLQSGNCTRSPRGLWGVHSGNQNNTDMSMEICAFSQSGDTLAVAGRKGYVHLVDWRRGGGQVVGSMKMNAAVKDVWWSRENELMTLGEDSEVYVWDVSGKRCLRRWKEDGGFGSRVMTGSRNSSYLAIGSNTGLVNVYGSESTDASLSNMPKPLKTIGNLTTSISTMCFNHDSQILALASKTKKDQLKMVHLPSLTVFSNWPTSATPLGHVTCIDFSPGSDYTAIGNNRGRVLLYNLKHFASR
ncbi:hypothetical protein M422DRAFT_167177 [Sphaerobolus stellatus SS14]|uniref:U3 small nucleolar RNA-associated protein 18 n=1 Tax=Sphaerobolus stellatus (strain SS14) TaxID=990650 RepID=A0A0C9VDT2_SPHS4|nr:hypothetical protein M422DRAFT_167177 [Sphaerobolus stellatus SS14]